MAQIDILIQVTLLFKVVSQVNPYGGQYKRRGVAWDKVAKILCAELGPPFDELTAKICQEKVSGMLRKYEVRLMVILSQKLLIRFFNSNMARTRSLLGIQRRMLLRFLQHSIKSAQRSMLPSLKQLLVRRGNPKYVNHLS